jgi:succinate dehydrogenase/fumarate reductase flavoprotein subunit
MDIIAHDIIVIGAGLAGQMAAIETSSGSDAAIISKVHAMLAMLQGMKFLIHYTSR